MTRPPPRSTLFPSTTLFRSHGALVPRWHADHPAERADLPQRERGARAPHQLGDAALRLLGGAESDARRRVRSEEHTSELQSQSNLVCRLLLEKKNAATHPRA